MERASAQVTSPSITPARIDVESPLLPDRRTDLPSLAVRNDGDSPRRYRMSALTDEAEPVPALGWVRFDPVEFTLGPGEGREVRLSVTVPKAEEPRRHRVLLQASVLPEPGASGLHLSVSVAVASVLEFEVGLPPARPGIGRYAPLLPLTLLAGAAGWKLAALFEGVEFQSPIRRKRAPVQEGSPADRARD